MAETGWIVPDWSVPDWIHAGTTTRTGGKSQAPYASMNLGDHVGDDSRAVKANRALLRLARQLPAEPFWLEQVHGIEVVDAAAGQAKPIADASIARQPGVVCAVLTADCLPLLLCNQAGTVVAAAHAGWRGLAAGVIEATVMQMGVAADTLSVWLGPAIGPTAFEVGDEVRQCFIQSDTAAADAFQPSPSGRWLADLYQLARLRLQALGVTHIYGGHWCTYSDQERFYSYRRDGVTGRMASLIWMDPAP